MKILKVSLLLLLVICLVACGAELDVPETENLSEALENDENSVPVLHRKPVHVYIGNGLKHSKRYDISDMEEYVLGYGLLEEDETKFDETKTFNLFGVDFAVKYQWNEYRLERSTGCAVYKNTDGESFCTIKCDEETGEVVSFSFSDYKLDMFMVPKTVPVNKETVQKLCAEYAQTVFPGEDPDKYISDFSSLDSGRFEACYYYIENEFITKTIVFELDEFGNPLSGNLYICEPEEFPEYTLDDYFYAAIARIEEFYSDKPDVAAIYDYCIPKYSNKAQYLWDKDTLLLTLGVVFTIEYTDGTEEKVHNYFSYFCK